MTERFSGQLCLRQARTPLVLISIVCAFGFSGCIRPPIASEGAISNSVAAEHAININTATLDELQRIPHIGEKLAAKIIEHRETNGRFRRVEHLMLIQGISDKRFRKIRPLVRVE